MFCVVSVCMATTSSEHVRVCVCVCVCALTHAAHRSVTLVLLCATSKREMTEMEGELNKCGQPLYHSVCTRVCVRAHVIHLCRGLEAGHLNAMGR